MAGRASYPDLGRTAPAPDRSARWDRDRFWDEREQNMTLERRPDREPRFEALPIRTRNPEDDDDYFRQSRRVPPREHSVDERYMHDRRHRHPHIDEEEDDELLVRERRRVMYDDMETPRPPSTMRRRPSPSESSYTRRRPSPSESSFTRRRPSPERERFRSPSPPRRPTARMMRRTSSVDTYDRVRKPKDYYDRDDYGPPGRRSDYRIPPNVPIPLPRHKALPPPRVYAEHDYYRDIHVSDPHRYGDEEFHAFQGGEKVREREVEKEVIHTRHSRRDRSRDSRATSRSHRSRRRSRSVASSTSSSSSSSSGGTTITSKSEYPKKGKTRIPSRLLSRRALIESGYPFVEEGTTTIIQKALGQEHIDHLLKMSDEYKKAELEITASRSSAGDIIEEREEHRTEIIEYTDTANPGPPPHHTTHYTQTTTHTHPPHVHTTTVHTHPPVTATYTQPVMVNPTPPVQTQQVDFAKTVQVRDVSPSRASSYSSWDSASTWTDSTYTTGTSCSTCSTATVTPRGHVHTTPQVVHVSHPSEVHGGELVVLDKSHSMSRSRSRHRSISRRRSRSRRGSYDSESIRSEISRLERQLARKERHGSRGDIVRAERLSTGELVLLEEEVERIEEPSKGVRLEKDKRGRLSISVPRNRR